MPSPMLDGDAQVIAPPAEEREPSGADDFPSEAQESALAASSGDNSKAKDDEDDGALPDIPRENMSAETAKSISISRTLAFTFGDLPFFALEIKGFFVRVRVGDRLYRWDRIVYCSFDNDNIYSMDCHRRTKKFNLYLHLEMTGVDRPVRIDALSSTPPTIDEVEAFQDQLRQQLRVHIRTHETPDKRPVSFPNSEEVARLQQHLRQRLLERERTDEDARAIVRMNTVLYPVHTNPVVHTSVLEKQTSVVTQAQQRRASSSSLPSAAAPRASDAGLPDLPFSQAGGMTQLAFDSQDSFAAEPSAATPTAGRHSAFLRASSGFGGASAPFTPSSPLPHDATRMHSEHSAPSAQALVLGSAFSAYATTKKRTQQVETYARLSQKNSEYNAMLRERGAKWEKLLDRKGNLVESTGLWEVDDQKRLELAERFDRKKEAEAEAKKGEEPKKDTGDPYHVVAERKSRSIQDSMFANFLEQTQQRQSRSQELMSPESSIPANLFELARRRSGSGSVAGGGVESPARLSSAAVRTRANLLAPPPAPRTAATTGQEQCDEALAGKRPRREEAAAA